MSFWMREIAGWLLVLLGLLMMYECYNWLTQAQFIQAGPLTIIAIIVFRAGIHLLKVAVAARISLKARDRLQQDRQPTRPVVTAVTRGS